MDHLSFNSHSLTNVTRSRLLMKYSKVSPSCIRVQHGVVVSQVIGEKVASEQLNYLTTESCSKYENCSNEILTSTILLLQLILNSMKTPSSKIVDFVLLCHTCTTVNSIIYVAQRIISRQVVCIELSIHRIHAQ